MKPFRLSAWGWGPTACVPAVCALLVLSMGCGNGPISSAEINVAIANRASADQDLVNKIDALPADQKQAFLQSHQVQVRHLMDDPDPKIRAAFTRIMKGN